MRQRRERYTDKETTEEKDGKIGKHCREREEDKGRYRKKETEKGKDGKMGKH